jgi:hypothetical protein
MYLKRMTSWNSPTDARYLDVQFGNPGAGTAVWSYSFTDTTAQHWNYHSSDKTLRNQNGLLQISACTGAPAQQWFLSPA